MANMTKCPDCGTYTQVFLRSAKPDGKGGNVYTYKYDHHTVPRCTIYNITYCKRSGTIV